VVAHPAKIESIRNILKMVGKYNFMANLLIRLKLKENHFYFRERGRFKKEE
jgi:hypothetical protein